MQAKSKISLLLTFAFFALMHTTSRICTYIYLWHNFLVQIGFVEGEEERGKKGREELVKTGGKNSTKGSWN